MKTLAALFLLMILPLASCRKRITIPEPAPPTRAEHDEELRKKAGYRADDCRKAAIRVMQQMETIENSKLSLKAGNLSPDAPANIAKSLERYEAQLLKEEANYETAVADLKMAEEMAGMVGHYSEPLAAYLQTGKQLLLDWKAKEATRGSKEGDLGGLAFLKHTRKSTEEILKPEKE